MNKIDPVCLIDVVYDYTDIIGISINVANNLLKALVAFDALALQKSSGIKFIDIEKQSSFNIKCSEQLLWIQNDFTIYMPYEKIEIMRAMILDVLMGNGFPGYHFDIDLNTTGTQLSFVFQ